MAPPTPTAKDPEKNSDCIVQDAAPVVTTTCTSTNPMTTISIPPEPQPQEEEEEPYTIFSRHLKLFIILMSATSSLFSPVSSMIYLPALDVLADYYHVSITRINLSVTTYMILQALAPMFFGDMADQLGRRPIYITTLTIYVAANIGLATQSDYGALLVLRALQSSGSSGTVALGNAVMADIAAPAERSGYISYVQAGMMLGPAIAPTIGGVLTQFLGWRALFWFLTIASGTYLVLYIPFVPETCRKIVENGSIPPQDWNRSIWNARFDRKIKVSEGAEHESHENLRKARKNELAGKRSLAIPNPLRTLRVIAEKDVALTMLLTSLLTTGFYMLMVPIPSVFADVYGFNQIQIGLCYLPMSAGSVLGTIAAGKLLDWNFRRIAHLENHPVHLRRGHDLRHFPIERARLQYLPLPTLISSLVILVWGWTLSSHTSLAAPLVLLFIGGACIPAAMNMQQALLIDMYPQSPATVTAAVNLCRCALSAGGTAIVQVVVDGVGLGWCYTIVGGVVGVVGGIAVWAGIKFGPRWREERFVREETRQREKERERGEGDSNEG
ncbi:unnamed protein product [Periconia digitata]|uniref:Major facilitator superfamily (MFS) profile domain-containing protein n=1 Tax=Periconia digitata TaxID=1303443 RepID=A0A9W4UDH8_9PLEO|nr:unnamed protein product [Periconia digitata]